MSLIALFAAAASAACDAPLSVDVIERTNSDVLDAWSRLDLTALEAAATELDAALPCVSTVLGPEDVAAYWRVRSFAAFSRGELADTELALAQARRVQPTYSLPTDVVPDQHPLRRMWDAAGTAPAPHREPLPVPAEGWLVVDGRRATDAPTDAPYLLQWVRASGDVGATAMIAVGAAPDYPLPPPERHRSRGFVIGGVAAGLGGAVGLGVASTLRARYLSAPPSEGPLQGVYTANHVVGVTGWSLLAVAGGLATTSLIVGEW